MTLPKDSMLVTIESIINQYKKRYDESEWSAVLATIEMNLCEEMILDLENIKDKYLAITE